MKTIAEVAKWCAGALVEYGDPAVPVCQLFFRWVETPAAYGGDELACEVMNGQFGVRIEGTRQMPGAEACIGEDSMSIIPHQLLCARRLLHGQTESGDSICGCCGSSCNDALTMARSVSDAFTAWDALRLLPSDVICGGCVGLLKENVLRFASIIKSSDGELRKVKREEMLPAYESECGEFVATWAITHKKHTWLYAGISTPDAWVIGTDTRTIRYERAAHGQVRDAIFWLLGQAVPSSAIVSGKYHPSVISRLLKSLATAEDQIAPHRASGLVEFLAFIGPRFKSPLEERIETMIDPSDALAGKYLAELARNSEFRKVRPLDFWGGFFDSRIERVRSLPLADITTRLMQFLGVTTTLSGDLIEYIGRLTGEETAMIEQAIRTRPKLVAALAYSQLKEQREAKRKDARS